MLAAVAWARRGVPAAVPRTADPIDEVDAAVEESSDDSDAEPAPARRTGGKRAAAARAPAPDDDDSSEDEATSLRSIAGSGLMHFKDNAEDPLLKLTEEDDVDSDEDDFTLQHTDLVLIGARSEEQASTASAATATPLPSIHAATELAIVPAIVPATTTATTTTATATATTTTRTKILHDGLMISVSSFSWCRCRNHVSYLDISSSSSSSGCCRC